MPSSEPPSPPGLDRFPETCEESDRLVICQDGENVTARQLRARASEFTAVLKTFGPVRVAVHSPRADVTLAAVLAAITTGCELLLLRELYPPDDPFWKSLEVAAVFGEQLELLHAPGGVHRAAGPAVLLTTSGTTGKPKVALHEMEKLLGRVRPGQPDSRWLLTYHPASFAGLQVLLTAFCARGVLVAFAGLSAADLVARTFQSGATHVSGTPTFWRALLLARRENDTAAFHQITLGGEAVDPGTLDALRQAFPNARLIHIYASTEAGALFAVKDGRAGFPAAWLETGVDGCGLRIREGALEVQSPRAMKNYCTKESPPLTADGWLLTGDLVEVNGDRVQFSGRRDNVINVGGGKVMPEQVEAALEALPFIKAARVSGVKNPLAGIVLAAEVVLAEPLSEAEARPAIYAALSGRLEAYKIPRIYKFVDRIPINAVGKKIRTSS